MYLFFGGGIWDLGLLESYDVERRPIAKRVLNNTEVISKLTFSSAGFAFLDYLKTRVSILHHYYEIAFYHFDMLFSLVCILNFPKL